MEHLKIGEKSDVIVVSMVTMTFQYGGYLSFKLNQLDNKFGPRFFILKNNFLKYNKQSDQFKKASVLKSLKYMNAVIKIFQSRLCPIVLEIQVSLRLVFAYPIRATRPPMHVLNSTHCS